MARAIKATLPHLPVVLLTGWGDQVAGDEGEEQSRLVKRVLSKPARLEDLIRLIHEATTAVRSRPVTSEVPDSGPTAST